MKIKLFIYFLLLFIVQSYSQSVSSQKIIYFGPQENTFVTSLEKDTLGRIWVGTEGGLVWFDGQSFYLPERYKILENEYINSLKLLNADSLLVIGWKNIYIIDNLSFLPFVQNPLDWAAGKKILNVTRVYNKLIFTNVSDTLLQIADMSCRLQKSIKLDYKPLSIASFNDLVVTGDEQSTVRIYQFINDTLLLKQKIKLSKDDFQIYSIFIDDKVILAPLTTVGLFAIHDYLKSPLISMVKGSENKTFIDIKPDPLNSELYWSGSQYSGVFHFSDREILESEKYSRELTNSLVWAILPDEKGRLIAGTQYGLTIFSNTNFLILNKQNGLSNNFIWSVVPVGDEIWIGTSKGLNILKKRKNSFKLIQKPFLKFFQDQSVFQILQDGSNIYLITTEFPNIYKISKNKVQKLDKLPLDKGMTVSSALIDKKQRLWIGSNKIIFLEHNNIKSLDFPSPADRYTQTYAMEELPDGHIVYGTIIGLIETDGKNSWFIGGTDTNRVNISTLFYDHEKNILFVGTTGTGLFQYNPENKILKKSEWDERIPGKNIYYINKFLDSLYVFGSELGVSLYNKNSHKWYYLNTSNGLSNNEINTQSINIFRNYLLVGTANGLNFVDLTKINTFTTIQPKLYISSIRPSFLGKKIILPFRNNFLEVNLGIIALSADPLFQTQYKIEGLDSDWLPLKSPSIYLRNLSPGHYVLKARTVWQDQVFSSSTFELPFEVYRPFWYSIYGIIIAIVIFSIVIYSIIRYRIYRYERLTKKLRKELEEEQLRTLEFESIITEIFKNSSMGILFVKENGEIISYNATAIELLSQGPVHLPENIFNIPLLAQNKIIMQAFQEIRTQVKNKETLDIHLESIEEKHLRFYFWYLKSRGENRIGILISDLSSLIKHKRMQAQVHAYNQVLATLSHYLNNTMAILALAEENYQLKPEERHKKLAEIARLSVKKVKFILDLLDRTINSENIKFRDYVDAKNLLIDIEEEIRRFNQQNKIVPGPSSD